MRPYSKHKLLLLAINYILSHVIVLPMSKMRVRFAGRSTAGKRFQLISRYKESMADMKPSGLATPPVLFQSSNELKEII